MHLNQSTAPAEVSALEDKGFQTLQAQLAQQGVELHRITGALGREAYTVNVRGALRTLDTLGQVQAYARILGVPLIQSARLDGIGGLQC